MKKYIGTKTVHAEEMSESQWHRIGRHLTRTSEEKGKWDKPGYHVIDDNGISFWSPKDVFEKEHHELLFESFPIPDDAEQVEYRIPGTVFPSTVRTIAVAPDSVHHYGGAHRYQFQDSVGFKEGESGYIDSFQEIQFVQKNADGTMTPGLQSEQLVIALIDRHEKLNAVFPSDQSRRMLVGLQIFLDACKERVEDRIARGVMGDLKR